MKSLGVYYNSGLVDLSGLGKVIIGDTIYISGNGGRIVMFDTSEMKHFNGTLEILENINWTYSSFASLESIGGSFYIPSEITQDESLAKYYPKLKSVAETLSVYNCNYLKNLNCLNSFNVLGSLSIYQNDKLTSLEGLEKISSLEYLSVGYNHKLKSLNGLQSLMRVNDYIGIYGNDDLITFDGFNNLNYVGELEIYDNDRLKSFKGLENLLIINGTLEIEENEDLETTRGLNNLEYVESIEIDLDDQEKLRDIRFGKKGSNLGYPEVEIENIHKGKRLNLKEIKKSFSSICKITNKATKQKFICNEEENEYEYGYGY